MYEDKDGVEDIDKRIHDEVFIQSIDRKERITRFLTAALGVDDTSARDEVLAADILWQLLREENPIADNVLEDAIIFLSEQEEVDPESDREAYRGSGISFYDRERAKQYIDAYWKKYNTAYPAFNHGGGDCTNFISQVLFAGGIPWVDDGNPANSRKSSNWYCKPGATGKDSERRITFSWKLAAVFKAHFIKRVAAHNMLSYAEAISNMNGLSEGVFIGDVVQFCYSGGVPYHTLAVTGFNRDPEYHVKDIVLASHDIDSNNRSLYRTMLKYPSDYKLRVYSIKEGP